MLTSDAGQLEVTELETLLDAECGCESPHNMSIHTGPVIALVIDTCSGFTKKVCRGAVDANHKWMRGGNFCVACSRKAKDCWRIIPI